MKTKFNKSLILKNAWKAFKNQPIKTDEVFSDCLKRSWEIAKQSSQIDINRLYSDYYGELLYYIKGHVRLSEDAEEIVNDVFLKANANINSFDSSKSAVKTWLYNIAKRLIIDHYRTDHSDHYMNVESFVDDNGKETYQIADSYNISDNIENVELRSYIVKALSNLKPKYKEIAELRFLKELSYDEIAERVNMPLGTVKGMICRCKDMLKQELQYVV